MTIMTCYWDRHLNVDYPAETGRLSAYPRHAKRGRR